MLTVFDLLNICELYMLNSTHTIVREFILEQFENISGTDEFFKLTSSQLMCLLTENSLKVVVFSLSPSHSLSPSLSLSLSFPLSLPILLLPLPLYLSISLSLSLYLYSSL